MREDEVGDGVFEAGEFGLVLASAGQSVDDDLVVGIEGVVGADEERPAAAGRVADRDALEGLEAVPPVGAQAVGVLLARGFGVDAVALAQGGEAFGDGGIDGALDDKAGEGRGCVVDAEAFALRALGHLRERSAVRFSVLALKTGEERAAAADAQFLEFGDGALEEVAENFDVDFLGEVVLAEALEAVGPRVVFEVEGVHVVVVGEESAVEGRDLALARGARGALVDGGEEFEEVPPAWVGRAAERLNGGTWACADARLFSGSRSRSSQKAMKMMRSRSFCAMRMAVSSGRPCSRMRWSMRRRRWSW